MCPATPPTTAPLMHPLACAGTTAAAVMAQANAADRNTHFINRSRLRSAATRGGRCGSVRRHGEINASIGGDRWPFIVMAGAGGCDPIPQRLRRASWRGCGPGASGDGNFGKQANKSLTQIGKAMPRIARMERFTRHWRCARLSAASCRSVAANSGSGRRPRDSRCAGHGYLVHSLTALDSTNSTHSTNSAIGTVQALPITCRTTSSKPL